MAQPESQCLRELRQPQCHKGTVWNGLVIQVRFLRSNYCNAFADGHSVKRFFFLIPFEWSLLCPEGQTSVAVLHLTVVQNLRVFFSVHSFLWNICWTWMLMSVFPPNVIFSQHQPQSFFRDTWEPSPVPFQSQYVNDVQVLSEIHFMCDLECKCTCSSLWSNL